MRDKETIEIALAAAETGHLVLSTLHTIDASKTVERIARVFPMTEQHVIRNRLAKSFRFIISQRLLPAREGKSRIAALQILKSTLRTREYLENGDQEGKALLDAMRDGDTMGTLRGCTISTVSRRTKARAPTEVRTRARTGY
jgi:twitching motility protein PilT